MLQLEEQSAPESQPAPIEPEDPTKSKWNFAERDEIAPGLSAIKMLGGGYRYEAYLAWSDRLRTLVVVKVVRPGLVEDDHTLKGLREEIEMLARLDHPVIVRSFGSDLDGPRPHVVLEHLEGPRLSSLLRRYGPLPAEQLVPLALQLASAVHYLGEERVVHLDIKPSNIIMAGPPRLIDLSVAQTFEQCESIRSPVGTDAYMAPEQCDPLAGAPIGPAADVWGIGATLARAATGRKAFSEGDHNSSVPAERWPQLIEAPEDLRESLPRPVAEPIMACLAFEPAARPTAPEAADQLEVVLDALPRPKISKMRPRLNRR